MTSIKLEQKGIPIPADRMVKDNRTCKWRLDGILKSECGDMWLANTFEILELFKYCPYCGAKIEAVK